MGPEDITGGSHQAGQPYDPTKHVEFLTMRLEAEIKAHDETRRHLAPALEIENAVLRAELEDMTRRKEGWRKVALSFGFDRNRWANIALRDEKIKLNASIRWVSRIRRADRQLASGG